MVGTSRRWKAGISRLTAQMMAMLPKTPMTAQKIMARLPSGRGAGWVRYPRKWATGRGRRGSTEGGNKGFRYLSMSKCHRDGPRRGLLGIMVQVAVGYGVLVCREVVVIGRRTDSDIGWAFPSSFELFFFFLEQERCSESGLSSQGQHVR